MIRKGIIQTIFFTTVIFLVSVYFCSPKSTWENVFSTIELIKSLIVPFFSIVIIGLLFGLYQIYPLRLKIMEILTHTAPPMLEEEFDDEIDQLAHQVEKINQKWEEQIFSLQRLAAHKNEIIVTQERQRIARDLHDAVSQQLFAISMVAAAMDRTIEGKVEEKIVSQIRLIEKMAGTAQAEMRALLFHLRPVSLEGKDFFIAIKEMIEEAKQKASIDFQVKIDDSLHLSEGIEGHLFRIIQEAISNILRHSKADAAFIHIGKVKEGLRVLISDNGIGIKDETPDFSSYGLSMMKERIEEIGASIRIFTSLGNGMKIDIRVPIIHRSTEDVDGKDQNTGD